MSNPGRGRGRGRGGGQGQPPPGPGGPGGPRGRGRGGPGRGGAQTGPTPPAPQGTRVGPATFVPIAAHVETVGVKKKGYVTGGRPIALKANAFEVDVIDSWVYHYDVAMLPDEKVMPVRVNMEIIGRLQTLNPNAFPQRASYDGKKNIYTANWLFNQDRSQDTRTFDVTLDEPRPGGKPPKVYKVRLTRVNEINAELLHQYVQGRHSWDNPIQTALQALNVVIRMDPNQKYPFNTRSFFTDKEVRAIGAGIELWRGYFQSIRPSVGRMLVNVDISTAMMYRSGRLIHLALEFLRERPDNVNALLPGRGLNEQKRRNLQKFLSGCRVDTESAGGKKLRRTITKISKEGADRIRFDMDGRQISVADYFRTQRNRPLQYPQLPCIEAGTKGGLIPMELCTVLPGQIMRKELPSDKTADMVAFSTKKPQERLSSIIDGLSVLNYGQSEYLRQFNMQVKPNPVEFQGRVLNPPVLRYGAGSKDPKIAPRFGAWNMIDKKFYQPKPVPTWIVVTFDDRRFSERDYNNLVSGLVQGFQSVGMQVPDQDPPFFRHSPQGNIGQLLDQDGHACNARKKAYPQLVVVVLPDGTDDVYKAVKFWGDTQRGVPTQCLKSHKCARANMQYWANVCLKINVKLGGINSVPDPTSSAWLSDPSKPTLVLGADAMHPPPGVSEKPSFAALVGSVDANAAKYVSILKPQGPRVELISELKEMAKYIINQYIAYRTHVEKKSKDAAAPKRILFYRDGVSEGQFPQVLEHELSKIKEACKEIGIQPKITLVVVGKRHHMRLFTQNPQDADKSGNAPAGTLVDQGICHPTDFDFYLQSHGGLLGTSRPAHYSVLHDENDISPDALASISFALCHVYARSTRSVSIPAPVYYADIVCSRAPYHYDPNLDISSLSHSTTGTDAQAIVERYTRSFRPLHGTQSRLMYFS